VGDVSSPSAAASTSVELKTSSTMATSVRETPLFLEDEHDAVVGVFFILTNPFWSLLFVSPSRSPFSAMIGLKTTATKIVHLLNK
jgi:hypothetical protein